MTTHARYYSCGYTHYHCGGLILERAQISHVEDERPRRVSISFQQDGQDLPYHVRDPYAMTDLLAWYLTPPALAAATQQVTLSIAPAQVPCPLCQRGTGWLFAITDITNPREVFFCGCETCLVAVRSSSAGSPHFPTDAEMFSHRRLAPSGKGG